MLGGNAPSSLVGCVWEVTVGQQGLAQLQESSPSAAVVLGVHPCAVIGEVCGLERLRASA